MRDFKLTYNYSNAIFKQASSKNIAPQVLKDLISLDKLFGVEKTLYKLLNLPIINQTQKTNIIKKITKLLNISELSLSFIILLIKNARIDYLSDIIHYYKLLLSVFQNVKMVTVTSTNILNNKEKEELQQFLQAELGFKEVAIEYEQNEELIGGFVVKYENNEVDYSIKGALNKLALSL